MIMDLQHHRENCGLSMFKISKKIEELVTIIVLILIGLIILMGVLMTVASQHIDITTCKKRCFPSVLLERFSVDDKLKCVCANGDYFEVK